MTYMNKITKSDRKTLKRASACMGRYSPLSSKMRKFCDFSSFYLIFYTFFAEKVINLASAAHNRKLIFHYITLKI